MNAEAASLPWAPDYLARLQERFFREFALGVQEWSRCVERVTRWEDEHLLDNPSPELLARHKTILNRLIGFGKLISLTTEHPEFPDRETAELVKATQRCFQNKLAMWHGPKLSPEESERILAACFPNES